VNYTDETVSGGLVNAQDPALLKEGELTLAENGIYLPDDPTINRMPGRMKKMPLVSAGHGVNSMVVCKFDNGNQYLVTQTASASGVAGEWRLCRLGLAGAVVDFTNSSGTAKTYDSTPLLASALGTQPICGVQYNNRWYLSNGTDGPFCLLQDGSIRKMGLLPVTQSPSVAIATATGIFGTTVSGFFEYWTTEVFSTTATAEGGSSTIPVEVESGFGGSPSTIRVTASNTQMVEVKLPTTLANPNATHFRVYRGGSKVYATDKVFPVGQRIGGDIKIGTASADADGVYRLATPLALIDGQTGFATSFATGATASGACTAIGNLSALTTSATGTFASATASATTDNTLGYVDVQFDWTSIKDPIGGIEVSILGKCSTVGSGVGLRFFNTDTTAPFGDALLWANDPYLMAFGTAVSTQVAGGFGAGWRPNADLASLRKEDFTAGLRLRISYLDITYVSGAAPGARWIHDNGYKTLLDTIQIKVWTNSTTSTETPFNAVILTPDAANNTSISVGAASKPVPFTTGTVFEGRFVSNDPSRPRHLVYTQGGFPEYEPVPYYTKLEVPEHNKITTTNVINNRLVVGLDGALVRVNFLVSEQDADFNQARDRVWEYISETRGAVNSKAAAVYVDPETGQQNLAFISTHGLYSTDGYGVRKLSSSLDWTTIFSSVDNIYTDALALEHDQSTSTLWIYTSTTAYVYHYVTDQWTGPNYMDNLGVGGSALQTKLGATAVAKKVNGRVVHLLGYQAVASGHSNGELWQCDSYDYSDEVSGSIASASAIPHSGYDVLKVRTRDLYLMGMGRETALQAMVVYGQGTDYATRPKGTLTIEQLYANAPTSLSTETLQDVDSQLMVIPLANVCSDGIRVTFTALAGRYGLSKLAFGSSSFGDTTLRA
jgi:hypothetical protein